MRLLRRYIEALRSQDTPVSRWRRSTATGTLLVYGGEQWHEMCACSGWCTSDAPRLAHPTDSRMPRPRRAQGYTGALLVGCGCRLCATARPREAV